MRRILLLAAGALQCASAYRLVIGAAFPLLSSRPPAAGSRAYTLWCSSPPPPPPPAALAAGLQTEGIAAFRRLLEQAAAASRPPSGRPPAREEEEGNGGNGVKWLPVICEAMQTRIEVHGRIDEGGASTEASFEGQSAVLLVQNKRSGAWHAYKQFKDTAEYMRELLFYMAVGHAHAFRPLCFQRHRLRDRIGGIVFELPPSAGNNIFALPAYLAGAGVSAARFRDLARQLYDVLAHASAAGYALPYLSEANLYVVRPAAAAGAGRRAADSPLALRLDLSGLVRLDEHGAPPARSQRLLMQYSLAATLSHMALGATGCARPPGAAPPIAVRRTAGQATLAFAGCPLPAALTPALCRLLLLLLADDDAFGAAGRARIRSLDFFAE